MIEIKGLIKRFKQVNAIDCIDAVIHQNQVISIIGPNGSGKTTLIKCILGMVHPNAGEILIRGESILKKTQYRSMIGYMPQISKFPEQIKVGQLIDMLKEIRNSDTMDEELIESFSLANLYNKPMRTLSGGMIQKVSACIAFLFNPSIVILDEPTAGLDPLASEILLEKIGHENKKGKCILLSSHILSDLDEVTTHVLYLLNGRIEFYKSIDILKQETGKTKLSQAIAKIMQESIK